MGPWHLDWYRERGLTRKVTKVVDECTGWMHSKVKVGDTVEYDEITEHYAGGRLDFWNNLDPDSMFPDEMSVPVMRLEDWQAFGKWLETFETDFPWTLAQLVELYERDNPKIRWWKDE